MDELFLTVLNMSLTASYVIIFVIVIRLFLKKFPKIYSYVLWFSVLFRLICPFSFDSIFSLIPENVHIPQDIAYSPKPEISSGLAAIDSAVNNVLPPPVAPAASANPMQIWLAIGEAVWLIGIVLLIIYSIFTTVKLYRKLNNAKHMEDNIYIINGFKTPFVFGIVNPKIYLPYHLSESEKSYVLLHEQTHIKRLDHIVKLIFFIVTCIHWFNPLVWIAFYLMGEDMELSCDEKVVKQMGINIKKEYSSSLLSMSIGRKIVGGSPIAFGENNTKGRIKNVLNYKKPALWVLIVASIVIVLFIIGLITNPKSYNPFVDFTTDTPVAFHFTENHPDAQITKSSRDLNTTALILEYFNDLDLVPIEWDDIPESKEDIYFSGMFTFGESIQEYVHINEIFLDELSYLRISSDRPKFKDGYYRIIDDEFDYKYIDGLISNSIKEKPLTIAASNEDRISSYLKEKSINTFTLYYELIDFIISDYQEEMVDGNIEAIFSYTIVHKNYDRDPDTVQYIKEAKERGDKNYQTYYDEYLQPQDMNFYFKAVIDKNGGMTLYTKNPAIENDEWKEVEMSDFVIGKITEEHESEKINRNEPIENDIAEYISYDYEDRSIYIAGLTLFEEFGTEEFGFNNEGSAKIINDENAIEFFITVSTGLVPAAGSITGPEIYFKMALGTNEIVEKKLTPAPNYAEIAKLSPEYINPDSIRYSENIIELSDERIVEIGVYLKEFILETESKFDYFTYED